MKKVTIIVPAYNEEESLPFLYERLEKLMNENTNYEFEILFVNDGSKDKTIDLIKEYREKDKRINYVDFARNFGKEIAMIAGLDYATGDCVIFISIGKKDMMTFMLKEDQEKVKHGLRSLHQKCITGFCNH